MKAVPTPDPRLELGEGFHLDPIRQSDKGAYLEHFTDPEIARNTMMIPFPYTAKDADEWLARRAEEACEPEKLFAIRDGSGFLIGSIGIVGKVGPDAYRAEIGYWLAAAWRGRGIMPRAIDAFAQHCFQRLALHRLAAVTFIANRASQRALEKAGFHREGLLRHYHLKDRVFIDSVLFARLAFDPSPTSLSTR